MIVGLGGGETKPEVTLIQTIVLKCAGMNMSIELGLDSFPLPPSLPISLTLVISKGPTDVPPPRRRHRHPARVAPGCVDGKLASISRSGGEEGPLEGRNKKRRKKKGAAQREEERRVSASARLKCSPTVHRR